MSKQTVTITLSIDDVESFLRRNAIDAAKYSAYCDYFSKRTYNMPTWGGLRFDDLRKEWNERFLRAKRIVESFGVEYEMTSEEETLTISYPYWINETVKIRDLGPSLGKVRMRSGGEPNYKRPLPTYRGGVHDEACKAAADRVVRRWRAMLQTPPS